MGPLIFDVRKEENPCALCAKMRRGILHNMCLELGIRKLALGHHFDDAVQTFFMNLCYGGRVGCFSPQDLPLPEGHHRHPAPHLLRGGADQRGGAAAGAAGGEKRLPPPTASPPGRTRQTSSGAWKSSSPTCGKR